MLRSYNYCDIHDFQFLTDSPEKFGIDSNVKTATVLLEN